MSNAVLPSLTISKPRTHCFYSFDHLEAKRCWSGSNFETLLPRIFIMKKSKLIILFNFHEVEGFVNLYSQNYGGKNALI